MSLSQDMAQLRDGYQELLTVQEEQEEMLQLREVELAGLKEALKEEVESHERGVTDLKEEHLQKVQKLLRAVDKAKEVTEGVIWLLVPTHMNKFIPWKNTFFITAVVIALFVSLLSEQYSAWSRQGRGGERPGSVPKQVQSHEPREGAPEGAGEAAGGQG